MVDILQPQSGTDAATNVNRRAFRCGHPKTRENMKIRREGGFFTERCRECHREHQRAYKAKARVNRDRDAAHLAYRVQYLPGQIEATRRKLTALENEARRYGMHDLVGGGQ